MGRKPKVAAPAEAPKLDISALSHEVAELPSQSRLSGNRKWDDNPFADFIRMTRDEGKGRQVVVPAYHAREVVSGIRNAADQVTEQDGPVGVRIICEWSQDGEQYRSAKVGDTPTDDTPVTILYGAKARRRSFVNDDQRNEARAMGFVNAEGKLTARPYFDWVEAGRPMAEATEGATE